MPCEYLRLSQSIMQCTDMHLNAMNRETNLESALIKVENINGSVILVSGTADELWPSSFMSDRAMDRMEKYNFTHPKVHWALMGDHYAWSEQPGAWFRVLDILDAMRDSEKNRDLKYQEVAKRILGP